MALSKEDGNLKKWLKVFHQTHIAIQEHLDGKTVDWMEQVSDEQYQPPNVNQ